MHLTLNGNAKVDTLGYDTRAASESITVGTVHKDPHVSGCEEQKFQFNMAWLWTATTTLIWETQANVQKQGGQDNWTHVLLYGY